MGLSADSVSRIALRDLAVAAIKTVNTVAAERVYDPNTLPQAISDLPTIVVAVPSERKDTAGTGAPQFDTTVALAVMGRVAGTKQADVEQSLDNLVEQVHRAILSGMCSKARPVQRVEYVETHTVMSAESEVFVGEATMIFGLLIPQFYEPENGDPFVSATVSTAIPPAQGPAFTSTAP